MRVAQSIKVFFADDLRYFRALQLIIAAICITIPLLLRLSDKEDLFSEKLRLEVLDSVKTCDNRVTFDTLNTGTWKQKIYVKFCSSVLFRVIEKDRFGFRKSVSDYVYSSKSYLFGMLYTLAAMLFINNGVVNMKIKIRQFTRATSLETNRHAQWYNIAIGISLILVVLFRESDTPNLHILFSVLFFLLNLVVIAFFPNPKENKRSRIARKITAVIAAVAVAIPLLPSHPVNLLWGEWVSLAIIAFHLIKIFIAVNKQPAFNG